MPLAISKQLCAHASPYIALTAGASPLHLRLTVETPPCVRGVRWKLGSTVHTCTFHRFSTSIRRQAAKAAAACLDAEYDDRSGTGSLPDIDETMRMRGRATAGPKAVAASAL